MIEKATTKDLNKINDLIDINNKSDDFYKFPFNLFDDDIHDDMTIAIFITVKDETITGFLYLHEASASTRNIEAEFEVIVHPDYRLQGIGKDLLTHAVKYAETDTSLNLLIAKILKENVASIKLCEKLGFIQKSENEIGCTLLLKI